MSFSEEVRAELAAIAPERECDRLAELSGLFHAAGRLHLRGAGQLVPDQQPVVVDELAHTPAAGCVANVLRHPTSVSLESAP